MDSLILTFNKKQLELYNELLDKENIELNFDTSLPEIDRFYIIGFDDILSDMESEAKILLKFNKRTTAFAPSLPQDEIKRLTPIYYNAILQIKRHTDIISGEAWKLSFELGEIDKALVYMNKKYADFLPYKAALYNKEKYYAQINQIDKQFKENIDVLDSLKAELLNLLEKSEKITNIVSDFIQITSEASNEPKFKNFDDHKFFLSVEAFIEQIKTAKNN